MIISADAVASVSTPTKGAELNNKARKKQIEDIELPPRDEEIADAKEEDEPEV